MNKMNSFIKQFIAIVNGDDAAVTAQKAWRQAESALKVEIAAREGDSISKEDDVTTAKEKLSLALVNNGKPIENRTEYIDNLITAKNNVSKAEKALHIHNVGLTFLKDSYIQLKANNE